MKFDVNDPAHRAVVEAARAWGVAPSVLIGRRITSVVQERDGIRTVTQEALWTDDDLQAALDLQAWESQLCPGCRQPLAETTAPENEDRYVIPHPIRCHRCTAIDQAHDRYQERHSPSALLLPVDFRGVGDPAHVSS